MSKERKQSAEAAVREIRRRTRRKFSPEEKVRIVLEGLRCEQQSDSKLCRREGIVANLYYRWNKDFLEAGKKQLAGDTVREATRGEVKGLRSENREFKDVVAEITLANRVLKKVSWVMARRTTRETHGFGKDGNHPSGRGDGPSRASDAAADGRASQHVLRRGSAV